MHQTAWEPGQPFSDGAVHTLCDSGAKDDLTEQDEHRHRDENVLDALLPDEVSHHERPTPVHEDFVQRKTEDPQHRRDGHSGKMRMTKTTGIATGMGSSHRFHTWFDVGFFGDLLFE